jgi:uncharacterized protein (DUF362 family)
MNRRTFVCNAALGTVHLGLAGLPAAQAPHERNTLRIDVNAPELPPSPLGMPGLFPGRVVEVFHPGSIVNRRVHQPAVQAMVDAGMQALTGDGDPAAAWRRFVTPADVVAIKVALLRVVIRGLNAAGVPNRQIVVYDRNSNQLEVNGYHALLPANVRVVGLDQRWTSNGVIRGGYDHGIFCEMDCFGERETRSYLATIVATEATKIIDLPALKEHNASGVTGCLKNLAYGSFNNVARTHEGSRTFTDPVIAVMCSVPQIRTKSVLHIMDGIRAVYHGGPFGWNPDFVWEARTLLIGTDPVAVDRIELEIVEAKRREVGAPPLADRNPQNLGRGADIERTAQKNPFFREPLHIQTASTLGLGRWELGDIDRRRLRLD